AFSCYGFGSSAANTKWPRRMKEKRSRKRRCAPFRGPPGGEARLDIEDPLCKPLPQVFPTFPTVAVPTGTLDFERRKTMAKRNVYRGLLLAGALLAVACAQPPQAEMHAAPAAPDEAKAARREALPPRSGSAGQH